MRWTENYGTRFAPYELQVTMKEGVVLDNSKVDEYENIIDNAIKKQAEDNEFDTFEICYDEDANVYYLSIEGKTFSDYIEKSCDATYDSPPEYDISIGELDIVDTLLVQHLNEASFGVDEVDLYQNECNEFYREYDRTGEAYA